MPSAADLPGRRLRVRGRGRMVLVVLLVALVVALASLRGIAGFYTDLLWFDSLGHGEVFTGVLGARVALAAIFTVGAFVVLWANLFIADKLAPRVRPPGPEEDAIEPFRQAIGDRIGLIRVGIAAVIALLMGVGASGRWQDWILFTNAQDFGVDDPLFDTDIGFYVFRLPFLSFLVGWAFAALVIVILATAAAHYLNGGIRVQVAAPRVTPHVKAHLSVLLGLLALLKAAGYWLDRFELNFSSRGAVDGATYTDVKAQLPALNLLILISLLALALLIVNIWRRGWMLPIIAGATWAFVAVVLGGVYPWFIQRFTVEPSESSREKTYIARNIEATRAALGLDDVSRTPFAATSTLTSADLDRNAETVRNIRLWQPSVLLDVFQRRQEVRNQYKIVDVDVDRYVIDGQRQQVMVAARELDTPGVPQSSWEARRLAYTHGYGLVMAEANSKTSTGAPELLARDIPVKAVPDVAIDEPGLYFGEDLGGYVVVGTDRREIDFQDQERTQFREYDGEDGVGIGSLVRRAAFALRFGDINPLISGNMRGDSKVLLIRDVRKRAEKLAPFLDFDADPYPIVIDGDVKWVLDAYTTTTRYPYAQEAVRGQLPPGSGLDHDFNYVRNPVKAVVDAYDGTVTFYVIDGSDPLLRAYRQAFPKLFTDRVPPALREHFRYPEDLFRVQTTMWGRYQIGDPDDFYNRNDAWQVAKDPGTSGVGTTTAPGAAEGEPATTSETARIEPYYLLMQLPGEDEAEFVLLRPFVPFSDDDQRQELTAFMVAKNDPDGYGTLETFVMPRANLPPGPVLAEANMSSDRQVAQLETLLGQEGSRIRAGNLLLVPIEQSLLYVRPIYVEAEATSVPELELVIVAFQDKVVVEDTLEAALVELFGDAPDTGEEPTDTPVEEPAVEDDIADLLDRAARAFSEADQALAEGDFAGYEEKEDEGRRYVEQARQRAAPSTTTTTSEPGAE